MKSQKGSVKKSSRENERHDHLARKWKKGRGGKSLRRGGSRERKGTPKKDVKGKMGKSSIQTFQKEIQ